MPKMIRSVKPTEHQIQAAIVEWAYKTYIEHPNEGKILLGPYLIKIPNEGKRSWAQGKKMKKEGLRKGASDLFLAWPRFFEKLNHRGEICQVKITSGFWYELKKPGETPTDEQLEFLSAMENIGYGVGWGDSVDKGIQAIKDYLGMK